jgi:hypothetical protein
MWRLPLVIGVFVAGGGDKDRRLDLVPEVGLRSRMMERLVSGRGFAVGEVLENLSWQSLIYPPATFPDDRSAFFAPEFQTDVFDIHADIYSFGMIILPLLTDQIRWTPGFILSVVIPTSTSENFFGLIVKWLAPKLGDRPTVSDLLNLFESEDFILSEQIFRNFMFIDRSL